MLGWLTLQWQPKGPYGPPQPSLGLSGPQELCPRPPGKAFSPFPFSLLCPRFPATTGHPCLVQQGRVPGAEEAGRSTPGRWTEGLTRGGASAHLRSTAISFSTRASLPRSAFLGMHLRATRCEEPRSWASTTSEKAPLRQRGGGREGKRQRGGKEGEGRESRGAEEAGPS